ncbi:MAG: hypothetical protein ACRENA_01130 [Vulcanimicrobiaceae bacterium]
MAAEFKSFAEIFRAPPPPEAPPISAFIPQTPPPERLAVARWEERLACALERLLREIATEVVGRELALAPIDVHAIVEHLVHRLRFDGEISVEERNGDIAILATDGETWIDASLGRRLHAAIDRALS